MNDNEESTEPMTTKVFDLPEIDLHNHQLVQQGYAVTDVCHNLSFNIPSGKTLIKDGGRYKLVDEL